MSDRHHRRLPLASASAATWPFGSDGDLTVLTGNTTTLTAGLTYDYNNITVQAGGVLQFTGGDGHTPTVLGYKTSMTVNGTIKAQYGQNGGGTFSKVAPDGFNMSYIIAQKAGGDGGDDGAGLGFWISGSAFGGGGGGGAAGADASSPDSLGNGGTGNDGDVNGGTAGSRGTIYGGLGGAGGNSVVLDGTDSFGGSGGGGAKNVHGGALYIKGGASSTTSGTGTITVAGLAGGAGGSGGSANTTIGNAYGAGGGGGGAGGSGGKITARFKASAPSWTYTITGGAGGFGGAGGAASSLATALLGSDGNLGTPGNVGSTDIATY